MWSFIRLTRPVNLLMIAYTMFAMRYWVIRTLISPHFELQFPTWKFALLVFSVMCIAAAGNVINDYFDAKIDYINKPEEVIIGFGVTRRVAMAAHFVLSAMGIVIGAYLAYSVGRINLAGIHLFCAATLWYYSSIFKRQVLLGNFVIALLAGIVPLTVALYELPLISANYADELLIRFENPLQATGYIKIIFYWVLGFSLFAFLLNFIREIVKDLADVKGDRENGRETLPIVLGYTYTRIIVTFLVVVTTALLAWAYITQIDHKFSLAYFILFFGLPFTGATVLVWMARNRNWYLWSGNLIKVVMLAGITYSYFIAKLLDDYSNSN